MFSIKESIKYAWEKAKEQMELVLFATLILVAAAWVTGVGSPLGLIVVIFTLIVRMGYTKLFLRIYDGETPKLSEMFKEYRTFWKYLGVSILYPLAVLGGLILLIIPGIIWAVRFSFSPMIVIDTKARPVAAMKESYAITKGNFWRLFLFWIAMAGLNFLGFIVLGVGLLISIPVTTLASVYIYRKLSASKAAVTVEPMSSPQVPQ